jgi:hypothetical protein
VHDRPAAAAESEPVHVASRPLHDVLDLVTGEQVVVERVGLAEGRLPVDLPKLVAREVEGAAELLSHRGNQLAADRRSAQVQRPVLRQRVVVEARVDQLGVTAIDATEVAHVHAANLPKRPGPAMLRVTTSLG